MNFTEVLELPLSDFLLFKRDSWIDSWNRTEEGREFLKTLWRLQQTSADVNAMHEYQGKEGER